MGIEPRKEQAAEPAPSRSRSGSAANTNPGRIQVDNPAWRSLPDKPTGIPESVKADLAATYTTLNGGKP